MTCLFWGFQLTPVWAEKESVVIGYNAVLNSQNCVYTIINRAYSELQYSLVYKKLPTARIMVAANSGSVDGVLGFVELLGYPNLVKVSVPLCYINLRAYSSKRFKVESFSDLYDLRIGVKLGSFLSTRFMEGHIHKSYVSNEILMNLLANGRLDIALMSERAGRRIIAKNDYPFYELPIILSTEYMYHFLNKKHIDLVERLEIVLKKLERSGYIAEVNQMKALDNESKLVQ